MKSGVKFRTTGEEGRKAHTGRAPLPTVIAMDVLMSVAASIDMDFSFTPLPPRLHHCPSGCPELLFVNSLLMRQAIAKEATRPEIRSWEPKHAPWSPRERPSKPGVSLVDAGGVCQGVNLMCLGGGVTLPPDDVQDVVQYWQHTFHRECRGSSLPDGWDAALQEGRRLQPGELQVIQYARASRDVGTDFHSAAWVRAKSRESCHAVCIFEEEDGSGGPPREAPYVARILRFLKLTMEGVAEPLRLAEVELHSPSPSPDGSPAQPTDSLFRVDRYVPDACQEGYDHYMVPLHLVVHKVSRCGPSSGDRQHFLRYTAFSRTLGGEA